MDVTRGAGRTDVQLLEYDTMRRELEFVTLAAGTAHIMLIGDVWPVMHIASRC